MAGARWLFPPMLFSLRLILSRVRPVPLSVEQVGCSAARILFSAGANHRKRDEHRKDKSFFIQRVNCILVFRNSDEANERPTL